MSHRTIRTLLLLAASCAAALAFPAGGLIVHLFNGDDVKGTVDANTEIECDDAATPTTTARAADDGGGGDDGDHHGSGDDNQGDDNQGDDDQGDDDENDQQAGCDVTELTPGAAGGEAEV